MSDFLNPIAELDAPDSGKIITPEAAHKIKDNHQFFCPDFDCKDPSRVLILAVSVNQNVFFRHKGNFSHEIRPETLLHKCAIRWFEGQREFEIPPLKTQTFTIKSQLLQLDVLLTVCEYRKLKVLIPDVKLCTTKGLEFALEIFVTSDIDEDKKKAIQEFNLPTIRINLSSFYKEHREKCRTDIDFINLHLSSLLTDIRNKSWVVPPRLEIIEGKMEWEPQEQTQLKENVIPTTQDSSSVGCLLGIASLGLAYLLFGKNHKQTLKPRKIWTRSKR